MKKAAKKTSVPSAKSPVRHGGHPLLQRGKTSHIEPTFDVAAMTDAQARSVLAENKIALLPAEARHFQAALARPLTLTELTIFSIQGSEHCSYRSSRRHLKNLPTKGKFVMMGPGEDSGIIEIAREKSGKKWGLVVSHESHNSPSQIVPYEGAATGVGGCVRDVLCMGARVIGCLDPLRFGTPGKHVTKYLTREVVRGIAGYGNPLGVPNWGGDIEFDSSFDVNCLVNVVAAGVLSEDEIIHSYVPEEAARVGYDIIVIGKPTDASGFGGASFSSAEVREEDAEKNKGAVQEPNPFLERHLLVASYDLFAILKKKKMLGKVSFKDMGAGGNVCASVEQVASARLPAGRQGYGAVIDIEKIHTNNPELAPHILACSETQERFCWTCHPSLTKMILDHYNTTWELPRVAVGAKASVIGKVTTGNYVLKYRGTTVIDAPAKLLTEGLSYDRPFKRVARKVKEDAIDFKKLDLTTIVKKLLASPNIASREEVVNRYDKNVQGATVTDAGIGGPAIVRALTHTTAPKDLKKMGVAIGLGGSGSLGAIDATLQAEHAVVEAVTNVVAAGCTPLGLTDCLNYGNPEEPARMAELVDGIAGLKSAADVLGTPFVSGNVSLYKNVNPSAIVACVGRIDDAADAIPAIFQSAGNALVLVGTRSAKLGGSELLSVLKKTSGKAFDLDLDEVKREVAFVLKAAKKKLIVSARDLHRGGVATAALEMAFGTGLGVVLDTSEMTQPQGSSRPLGLYANLFAENPGFLLEVDPDHLDGLASIADKENVTLTIIGGVSEEPDATIVDSREALLDEKITKLEKIWRGGLKKILVG